LGPVDDCLYQRTADVSGMQTPDGIGAHLSRQAQIREAHVRMLHLRTYRDGVVRCGSNEDRCGRLACRRIEPASVSLGAVGDAAG